MPAQRDEPSAPLQAEIDAHLGLVVALQAPELASRRRPRHRAGA